MSKHSRLIILGVMVGTTVIVARSIAGVEAYWVGPVAAALSAGVAHWLLFPGKK